MKTIAIATGTRADWGLLSPLAKRLVEDGHAVEILPTNAHFDPALGFTINEIRKDGFNPRHLIPAEGDAPEVTSQTLTGYADVLRKIRPDMVVILGDRFEMLGVATAALLVGTPIMHIAGGTVSEGAYDDNIRNAISMMATEHFPETPACARRLASFGIHPTQIHTAGALGVWTAMHSDLMSKEKLEESIGFRFKKPYLVVTLHAATAPGNPTLTEATQIMLDTLEKRLVDLNLLITYPNNDEANTDAILYIQQMHSRYPESICVIPSLGHKRYLAAVAHSVGVVGNSSSGIVEVPSLGVPTLDIGNRQKGREHGPSVVHAPLTADGISKGLDEILSDKMRQLARQRINPYAKENTLDIISQFIINS